jgi:hypothetical protein
MAKGRNLGLRAVPWLSVLALIAVPGCGADELNSPTAAKLRGISTYYLDLAFARSGKGPANEKEFKKHLRGQPGFALEMNGVDPKSIDAELFVSERDQEPFVVLYGLTITRIAADAAPLVAHEKTGKNGKRLAVLANNKVELVDEAGLEALRSAKP